MINVFKKRTRLYALTTSALFLLQGVNAFAFSFLPSFSFASLKGVSSYIPGIASIPSLSYVTGSNTSQSDNSASQSETLPKALPVTSTQTQDTNVQTRGDSVTQAGVPGSGVPGSQAGEAGQNGLNSGALEGARDGAAVIVPELVVGSPYFTTRCSLGEKNISLSQSTMPSAPIFCNNGQTYTLQKAGGDDRLTLTADKYGRAISVSSPVSVRSSSSAVTPTVVSVSGISIVANERESVQSVSKPVLLDEDMGAIFADAKSNFGAEIKLSDVVVDGFLYGIRAVRHGMISMNSSSLDSFYVDAMASSEGIISLESTLVNANVIGLWSDDRSIIKMREGTLSLGDATVGVIASEMGIVLLDEVKIQITTSGLQNKVQKPRVQLEGSGVEQQDSDVVDFKRVVLLSRDGYISFKNGTFNIPDTTFLQIAGSVQGNLEANMQKDFSVFPNDSLGDGREIFLPNDEGNRGTSSSPSFSIISEAFSDIHSSMNDVIEHKKMVLGVDALSDSFYLNAVIKSSSIKITGKNSYGIHFDRVGNGIHYMDAVEHMVLLQDTALKVPNGVAIYNNGLKGEVFLQEDSEVSGGLLLKAENSADLSVFVRDSILSGATRVDQKSRAKLFLSHGSEWNVTKSLYEDSEDENQRCIDSCISSVSLDNSNITFVTSTKLVKQKSNGSGTVTEYRNLRIGEGTGTVYSAKGDSVINFNVDLSGKGTGQISDRLLIHGNVSGTTAVKVRAYTVGWEEKDKRTIYSIPLIQVFGKAEAGSFRLVGVGSRLLKDNEYITLGTPYQYVLRAYGPKFPPKMEPFESRLITGNSEIWDFRLEDKNLPYDLGITYLAGDLVRGENTPSVSSSRESVRSEGNGTSVVVSSPSPASTQNENSGSQRSEIGNEDDGTTEDHTIGGYEGYEEGDSHSDPVIVTLGTPNTPANQTTRDNEGAVSSSSSSRGRSSITLTLPGVGSGARSDTGDILVISTDGISLTAEHTISNRFPSIRSVTSTKPSASVISETSAGDSNGPIGRVLLLNNGGKEAVSSTCDPTRNNGGVALQTPYSCDDGKSHTITNLTLKVSDSTQHSMHAKSQNTVIKLEGATISGAGAENENNANLNTLKAVSAVLAENKAEVVLDNKSAITSSVIGLEAISGGKVKMNDGSVNARYVGALAGSGSSIDLTNTTINVTGDLAVAGLASKAGAITMNSGIITQTKGVAVRSEDGGSVKLDKVNITVKKEAAKLDSTDNFGRAAFLLSDNASVDFKNGNVLTDAHALWVMKRDDVVETGSSRRRRSSEVRSSVNHANIEFSTVNVEGNGTYGIYFDGVTQKEESQQSLNIVKRSAVSKQEKAPISIAGTVSLKATDFEVENGVAIYGNNSGGHVSLENKTTLVGDLLLKAENDSNISLSVNGSIVAGGVRVDKSSYAKLDLVNSSEWLLKRTVQKSLAASDSGCVDSCVSSVRLVNSAIDFTPSESGGKYQTLHIGNGNGTVYEAQGDAVILLNARLNPHDSNAQQVTDRLVIHGDVSGKTKIHVRGDAGNVGNGQTNAKIGHSVSVIQVYGQAKKDSFQLDGDYVALRNSPYKYTLRGYAPEATSKQEHVQQKFVRDGGAFWNFRLENQYVKSSVSAVLPEQFVRSVVPQVPTYLVLPNSVFHTGLMDINNQNKQLETLRMTATGMVEVRENPALYLRGYGGSYHYTSDLSALEYGYGGDLDYRGVEAGVLLQTIETTDSALSFGVMGTYGKLSLQPLDVEQSQESAFDKWTATVYGSMQHNVGFYVDGLLSYGQFKGDVLTLARGTTATLKGNPLNVSLIGGQTIATGYKGFVFDPQVQVVYQHLQFNRARDIDNFDIEMGNLDQWVARVGGRLIKIPTGSEGVNAVAFYGKLYLAHGFGERQSVHFSDAFKLGAFGSSLEAGVGINAKLLPQFSLHADVLYQHKLNKAGFSGASFSGGVRYQF
ncbi:autotransporter outer membrane beta-barrel domain-containing protein [Bartonella gabonensis]|uniref:autotransporter outer membrane beta-barrel domain-containing protein n=1 Tax=Bartonella gabonensis TaxID=2699889 RepID=UPI001588C6FD|nr:autotransporter outer membrane beta-barrel domain-containing protein [Bartonella gabonensis]